MFLTYCMSACGHCLGHRQDARSTEGSFIASFLLGPPGPPGVEGPAGKRGID